MTRQEHGCDLPDECSHCGCPRFTIVRQYKTRGLIHAVWKCDFCNAMNRTATKAPEIRIEQKRADKEPGENGAKRRGKRPPEKRDWW
jgi:hypothetical protein